MLFSASGSFEEKPVDTPCDPPQDAGVFEVSAGGSLVARITGDPPAPNQWSLHNNGVSLYIGFEPLLGDGNYGPSQQILFHALPAQESETEQGASWSGPGRLHAVVGAAGGSGPLTGSCFGQSYTVEAEVVEVAESMPIVTGMTLYDGDRIVTEDGWGEVLIAGSQEFIGPGSEIIFQTGVAGGTPTVELPLPDWVTKLPDRARELAQDGLPMPEAYYADPPGYMATFSDSVMAEAYDLIRDQQDPCEAAVTLKLFLESKQHPGTQTLARSYDWAVDTLSIWLLPNEWNALSAFVPVPGLGVVANLKNGKATVERIMTEATAYQDAQKAADALATFSASREMTAQQVEQRRTELNQQIVKLLAEIEDAKSDMRVEIARYEVANKLAESGCLSNPLKRSCGVPLMKYGDAIRSAQYNYYNRYQPLAQQIIALGAERHTLVTYRLPLAQGNCDALRQEPPPTVTPGVWNQICNAKDWQLIVGKGLLHVVEHRYPLVEPAVYLVNDYLLKPDGTEFIIEKKDDLAFVRVLDGAVVMTGPDGHTLTVEAGFQASLPDGEITALEELPLRRVSGIPLNELELDSDTPQPYGAVQWDAAEGILPPGWVWQEPNKNLNGPGDATYEIVNAETLRITVPNENEFYGHRSDAPRLLHKVTGDFDLEADLLLESPGDNFAFTEFLLFTPDTPLGYLAGQMQPDGLGAHYYVAAGGWNRYQNANYLGVANRDIAHSAPAPDEAVRVKLSRRGNVIKTRWSVDDGATWTLSNRQTLPLPETIWAGWMFKRMAYDGVPEPPAVTTLRDVRLTSAPLNGMLEDEWDVIGHEGTVAAFGADLFFFQDGTAKSHSQVYSPWTIDGDFDLIVRYDAPALERAPGQERYIHVAVTTNDEKNHAYVRHALTPDLQRMNVDMAIDGGWYRYFYQDTQESSGRVRLVRQDGLLSGYIWQDNDWLLLSKWGDGFSDPVYLDFRFQWITPEPSPQMAHFTIERLETDEGVLFDTVDVTPPEPETEPAEQPALQTEDAAEPAPGQEAGPARRAPAGTRPPAQSVSPQPTPEPVLEPTPEPVIEPTPEPAPQPALTGEQRLEEGTVFDDFSSTALGWSIRDNEAATTGYESGGYALLVKQPTYWVMSKTAGDFAPMGMEFDATVTPGSSGGMYGVICHYRNGDNYDFLSVDPETLSISAARYVGGKFVYVTQGPDGVAELPSNGLAHEVNAANHIRAVCYNDRLELTVNGVLEGAWPLDPPADGGNAALFVYGFGTMGEQGYKVIFDNFAAWRDAPAP